jgi:hypothetical protein
MTLIREKRYRTIVLVCALPVTMTCMNNLTELIAESLARFLFEEKWVNQIYIEAAISFT